MQHITNMGVGSSQTVVSKYNSLNAVQAKLQELGIDSKTQNAILGITTKQLAELKDWKNTSNVDGVLFSSPQKMKLRLGPFPVMEGSTKKKADEIRRLALLVWSKDKRKEEQVFTLHQVVDIAETMLGTPIDPVSVTNLINRLGTDDGLRF